LARAGYATIELGLRLDRTARWWTGERCATGS